MAQKRKPSLKPRDKHGSGNALKQQAANDVIGIELRKLFYWAVVAGIVLYCLLFLMTPFGPFDDRVQRPERFLRLDFFLQLLDPEYLKYAWFGDVNTFSLSEAYHNVIKGAAGIAAVAFSIGFFVLSVFRVTKHLSKCECFVFSSATGFSILSTLLLVIGLCGGLNSDVTKLGILLCLIVGVFFVHAVMIFCLVKLQFSGAMSVKKLSQRLSQSRFNTFVFLLAVPSLLILLFGGLLPPVEYDVTSYHAPGARHFYETGHITFAPHNVYTNMPFAAEMFFVLGMIVSGDWYLGTLIGKLIISYCTLIAGIGVYAFAKRLHSSQAGMVSFLLYVSLPWVSWVSTAGLIDCVFGMYLLLAVFALYLYVQSRRSVEQNPAATNAANDTQSPIGHRSLLYLTAYMAGSAAACKYTAVPFLVLPMCIAALYFAGKRPLANPWRFDRRAAATLGLFALSVALPSGLWYAKNVYHTDNSTYPLMYNVFGDRTGTWDAAKNERWHAAHSSTDYSGPQFVRDCKRTLFASDWLAPVLVPLALLPFLRRKQSCDMLVLAAYIAFYLALWWLLTHRLERFWVPILPLITVLAGIGAMFFTQPNASPQHETRHRTWPVVIVILLLFNTAYTFFPNAVSAPGKYSRFGFGVEAARVDPNRVMPLVLYFNANPPQGKLLLIGDAEVFDYAIPVLYNTCFDDTLFDELFFDLDGKQGSDQTRNLLSKVNPETTHDVVLPPLRSVDDMRQRLREQGISHIVVNWAELARFRSQGNYGYTSDLVQPHVFDQLVQLGVLQPMPRASESPNGIPTLPEQFIYCAGEKK